jgi:hypothetical protein
MDHHEPGDERLAAAVDARGVGGHLLLVVGAHRLDAAVADQHGTTRLWIRTGPVDHGDVLDRDHGCVVRDEAARGVRRLARSRAGMD